MIGLLVTGILSRTFGSDHVYAIEMNAQRGEVAKKMGAGAVIHPQAFESGRSLKPNFDVCIEVSGNAKALQVSMRVYECVCVEV